MKTIKVEREEYQCEGCGMTWEDMESILLCEVCMKREICENCCDTVENCTTYPTEETEDMFIFLNWFSNLSMDSKICDRCSERIREKMNSLRDYRVKNIEALAERLSTEGNRKYGRRA